MAANSSGKMQQVLKISLAATFCYVVATFYFGVRAHSLALISESGHNVSDMLAIVLSFVAVYFQTRPATDEKTFGYQRAGVLAAFVNALTLIVLAAWIGFAALHRFAVPEPVQPKLMMAVAAAGVLMNGCIAGLLWRFSGGREHPQRLSAHAWRYAIDRGGDRGRRRDPVYRDDVDRSGAVDDHRRDDSVQLGGNCARDAAHPARGDAKESAIA